MSRPPITQKKPHPLLDAAFCSETVRRLTLGELEALAGAWLTSLFPFLHAWVTCEEAKWLDQLAVLWVHLGKGAGDRVTDGNSLCVGATTLDDDVHIELVRQGCSLERSEDGVLQLDCRKIFFKRAAVDEDLASAFGQPHAGNCGFAAASGAFGSGSGHVRMTKN